MKSRKGIKRRLAFLMTLALLIGMMPVSAQTLTSEGAPEAAVEDVVFEEAAVEAESADVPAEEAAAEGEAAPAEETVEEAAEEAAEEAVEELTVTEEAAPELVVVVEEVTATPPAADTTYKIQASVEDFLSEEGIAGTMNVYKYVEDAENAGQYVKGTIIGTETTLPAGTGGNVELKTNSGENLAEYALDSVLVELSATDYETVSIEVKLDGTGTVGDLTYSEDSSTKVITIAAQTIAKLVTVSGDITDASTTEAPAFTNLGATNISIVSTPGGINAEYTAGTGAYTIQLPANKAYTLAVSDVGAVGYTPKFTPGAINVAAADLFTAKEGETAGSYAAAAVEKDLALNRALFKVSGKVTIFGGGNLEGVDVTPNGTAANKVTTESNGDYEIWLPAGQSNTLVFTKEHYKTETVTYAGESELKADETKNVAMKDEILSYSLSGTLSDFVTAGTKISGSAVSVEVGYEDLDEDEWVWSAAAPAPSPAVDKRTDTTAADTGAFSLTGIKPTITVSGEEVDVKAFRLTFTPTTEQGTAGYIARRLVVEADGATVAAGVGTIADIPATLTKLVEVTGKVTDSVTSPYSTAILNGIEVTTYDVDGNKYEATTSKPEGAGATDGTFVINLPAQGGTDKFSLSFNDPTEKFDNENSTGELEVTDYAEGTDGKLDKTSTPFSLARALFAIYGRVKEVVTVDGTDTDVFLPNVKVILENQYGTEELDDVMTYGSVASETTEDDIGKYVFWAAAGTYRLRFINEDSTKDLAIGREANVVVSTADVEKNKTLVDVLDKYTISGSVTNFVGGTNLAGITVTPYASTDGETYSSTPAATAVVTETAGTFSFADLPGKDATPTVLAYKLVFEDKTPEEGVDPFITYELEVDLEDQATIAVGAVTLTKLVTVSGYVADSVTAPFATNILNGIAVSTKDELGVEYGTTTKNDEAETPPEAKDGYFEFKVPAQTTAYTLTFIDENDVPKFSNNPATTKTGVAVSTYAEVTISPDVTLTRSRFAIAGTVFDLDEPGESEGEYGPLQGVKVSTLVSAATSENPAVYAENTTNADGEYVIWVPAKTTPGYTITYTKDGYTYAAENSDHTQVVSDADIINIDKTLESTDNSVAFEKLAATINNAKDAKEGVAISTDGNDVHATRKWVTLTDLQTFNTAIATAEAVTKISATDPGKATVFAAATTLETAITTFNGKKAEGKNNAASANERAVLRRAIASADAAMAGVAEAANAAEVLKGRPWATTAQFKDLSDPDSTGTTAKPYQKAVETLARADATSTEVTSAAEGLIKYEEGSEPTGAVPTFLAAVATNGPGTLDPTDDWYTIDYEKQQLMAKKDLFYAVARPGAAPAYKQLKAGRTFNLTSAVTGGMVLYIATSNTTPQNANNAALLTNRIDTVQLGRPAVVADLNGAGVWKFDYRTDEGEGGLLLIGSKYVELAAAGYELNIAGVTGATVTTYESGGYIVSGIDAATKAASVTVSVKASNERKQFGSVGTARISIPKKADATGAAFKVNNKGSEFVNFNATTGTLTMGEGASAVSTQVGLTEGNTFPAWKVPNANITYEWAPDGTTAESADWQEIVPGDSIPNYPGASPLKLLVRRAKDDSLGLDASVARPITLAVRPFAPNVAQNRLNTATGLITGVNARQQYLVVDADLFDADGKIDATKAAKFDTDYLQSVLGFNELDNSDKVIQGWTNVGGSNIRVQKSWVDEEWDNPVLIVRTLATATAPASLLTARNKNYTSIINLAVMQPNPVFTGKGGDAAATVSALFIYNAGTGVLTANAAALQGLGYARATQPEVSVNGVTWVLARTAKDLRPYLSGEGNNEIYVRLQGVNNNNPAVRRAPSEAIKVKLTGSGVILVP
ncbi:MAG: hypothetical protein LBI54_00855 [Lachnospiraceae bacterium]|jgi:hypothetical protein|nr:hypothetical protein [Lachnospiraceae bacterium]